MRLRLRVVPNAERQIRDAVEWWHANRPAAPDLFHQELRRGFELITTQPEVGPVAADLDLQEVQRLHLARIRYHLYYQAGDERVQVLALWHTSRGAPPDF